METNDQRNSEDPSAERVASAEELATDHTKSDDRTLDAVALEALASHESVAGAAPELNSANRDREISLLEFVPISNGPQRPAFSESPVRRFRPNLSAVGVVAGLACLACIGAGVAYDRLQYSRLLAAKTHDTQMLVSAVNGLKGRLEAIEATRDKDQATDLRRVLAEIKTGVAATRDFGTTLTQLSTRVDHIEKDQSARFDKLGDRIDHEASARLADMTARLDKLEKKAATPIAIAVNPAPPAPPKPPQPQAVSNEVTGSIEKPKPRLRGFTVEDVRDGFAVVDSRDGPQPVIAGDFIPGAGRVLRIERHGHDWVVVTTLGVITADMSPY